MRQPIVAGRFYAGAPCACLAHLQRVDVSPEEAVSPKEHPVAAIVPHAGWDCSGRVAMKVYRALQPHVAPGTTFVLFGSVHSYGVPRAGVYSRGGWDTPLGPLAVDEELAAKVLQACGKCAIDDPSAHGSEHSIEVQLPMLRYVFGEVRMVPIAAPPRDEMPQVGRCVVGAAQALGRPIVVIGTTDMTHYGAIGYGFAPAGPGKAGLDWVKRENDPRMLRLMESLRADAVIDEARTHQNACGAGAVAATLAAAQALGSDGGKLVEYTTSYDVLRDTVYGGQIGDFVGYAGMIF
ncbi:MAG TPA: AmmeMemoRadiSam system protein B [Phycisphaerae bacterium]|nr:AmmeMemoRadiSam system protein B [Phycisphaerae bacterium]HOI56595.1 AmmeMemoRadiSam system protein B [Phycisphaerae bacterium]